MGNFPQDFPTTISHNNFLQDFPTRFPARFPTRFSRKIFLQDFLQDFPTRFPARFSCKIFCKISPQDFPQDFPTRFSHKIFLQDFPARFSCKIFPSWILIGWLPITLFQMLNFQKSLPFLNWLFPLLHFPQEFPATISCNNFPQDFAATISRKIFLSWILIGWLPITLFQMLNFHQSLPFLNWLFPLLHFLQDFPARFSRKIFPTRFSQAES